MEKIEFHITELADIKLRVYMAENNISDKRDAINEILEDF